MSNQSNIELIDEDEIRAALRPWRPNADAFADAVHVLIAEKESEPSKVDLNRRSDAEDGLALSESRDSQIAASITPIQLLLGGTGLSSSKASFATLSFANKIFAVLAMPCACFLMIGVTLVGMLRIQAAQKNQKNPTEDLDKLDVITKGWWKRYGWIAVLIFAATLFAPFYGGMTPLLILLVGSGVAAVSLFVHLAKENLASRKAIGSLAAALGLAGQASGSFTGIGEHWLDQHLVTAVLFGGALLIGALVGPPHFKKNAQAGQSRIWLLVTAGLVCLSVGLAYLLGSTIPLFSLVIWGIAMAIFLWMHKASRTTHLIFWIAALSSICAVVGFHAQTLWRPLSRADVRSYVESFQDRRSASWNTLQGPAVWLEENGIEYDKTRLRESFDRDLEDEGGMPRVYMLTIGVRTGLLDAKNLIDTEDVIEQRKSLIGRFSKDGDISSLGQYYFAIAAIVADPALSDSDRDILASRLMATWDKICSKGNLHFQLDEALMVTELLERIDRPCATDRMTKDVHHWLVGMQLSKPQRFQLTGGFRPFPVSKACDRWSTIPALQLMDRFGVPEGIDFGALRSYLRPSSTDRLLINQSILTKVGRERLNALTDAPRPTIQGYLIREVPLCLAMLLVTLFFYATISAPLAVEEADSKP